MSEVPPSPGWWKGPGGYWYPPEVPPPPRWWKARDGNWYPPESAPTAVGTQTLRVISHLPAEHDSEDAARKPRFNQWKSVLVGVAVLLLVVFVVIRAHSPKQKTSADSTFSTFKPTTALTTLPRAATTAHPPPTARIHTSPATTTISTQPTHTPTSAPPGVEAAVPNVTGQELGRAEASLLTDRLGYKVSGGSTLGVEVASDWIVCSQLPLAGTPATALNLVVAPSCT